jgi:hypothetical protein
MAGNNPSLSFWDGSNEIALTENNFSYWNGTTEQTFTNARTLSYWNGTQEISLLPVTTNTDTDIDLTGYTLTFSDEFNSLSVTTSSPKTSSTWYYLPPYGSAGYYSDSTWDINAFSVAGGILSNRAWVGTQPGTWGTYWYSGNISSVDKTGAGFAQTYGYFETKVKMPASGTGAWPAFWLMPTTSIVPAVSPTKVKHVEIDIFEWYGKRYTNPTATMQQSLHKWNPDGSNSGGLYAPDTPIPGGAYPWQDYHIYGCKVDPVYVTWYIDGVQTNQVPTPIDYLTGPLYIMVDYAVGGGWPRTGMVDGSEMLVDWVRVYSLPA